MGEDAADARTRRRETFVARDGPMYATSPMLRSLLFCVVPVLFAGCIHVSMDPIKVHAVVDVNVKMEKAVTDLLADIYGDSTTVNTDKLPATTP